jgi:hypothetical protein
MKGPHSSLDEGSASAFCPWRPGDGSALLAEPRLDSPKTAVSE